LKRQSIEYEYQLKAAVKQQRLQEELSAQDHLAEKNRTFVRDLFDKAEKDRRETHIRTVFQSKLDLSTHIEASTSTVLLSWSFCGFVTLWLALSVLKY
jgi:hypothetical protein